ncbi:MAG TPA: NADP-dependent oxidoreductase [Opitutaceae bacterium]|jgi:NADPH:quinone reductase-like Zn-dependent oxidoreductase
MKAMRIHSFGTSDVLRWEDVSVPSPGPGEVLVKVFAAGVNPVDYKIRSGNFRRDLSLPLTLGREVSGVIEAVGPEVAGFPRGQEVYGMLAKYSGGYAEFARALAREIAPKPKSLDHIHAAAVPLAATTAWQGLFDHGQLRKGERVLILGAAGGGGHFAVQFARHAGARVIATARSVDLEFVHELGADDVIDYQTQRFEDEVSEIDLVLDLVAGESQDRAWRVLRRHGRLVSALGQPAENSGARSRGIAAIGFMADPRTEQLAEIGELIDDREVTVVVERILPLPMAAKAQDELEQEHIRGKMVLVAD